MSDELRCVAASGRVRSLPILPRNWVWTTVGEISDVFRGASPRPKGDPRYFGGPIPWIMISDVTRQLGKYLFETREGVTDAGAALSRRLPSGSLILSNSGTVCVPKLLAIEGCIHDGFVSFNGLQAHVSLDFAYWWFENVRGQIIDENRQGITQVNLNTNIVRDIQFPLAPREEQLRIVAEIEKQFTRLDAAVAGLKRVQANLKRYRASVLKAACEGQLVPTEAELARKDGRDYESASELLERVLVERRAKWEADQLRKMIEAGKTPKNSEWNNKYRDPSPPIASGWPSVPDGWAFASLEQLTSASRPICYGILMPKENVPNGVLYVRVKDMKNDVINLKALYRTAPKIAAEYGRASLKTGDLLLAIRGTYGRVAEVPSELDGGNITQDTARLAVSKLVNRDYIAACLRSDTVQRFFKRVARGVAVKGVNIADVRVASLLLPPKSEQDRIVTEIERGASFIDALISTAAAGILRSRKLRQAMLKAAFSGTLVPQDPNDEPASVLMERVRSDRSKQLPVIAARSRSNGRTKRTSIVTEAT
jgi:type I restriction enzyme, S subunit